MPRASAVRPPVAFTADDLPTWQTNGIVWAMAESSGIVFAGGTFSQIRPPEGGSGSPRPAVNFAAFNAATGEPSSCRLSFTVGSGSATVRALAVSPDKKTLYAGGYFGAVNGVQASSLAAVDIATCTPKPSFRPSFPATVRALAVTGDSVYAGGDFNTVGGQVRKRFAAVRSDSGAVLPFTANADEPGRAVEVLPGGKVALGGDFFRLNDQDSHTLAIVDGATGKIAKSFPSGFMGTTRTRIKDIVHDGQTLYTASEGTFDGRIALSLTDYQQRWRDTCAGATQALLPHNGVLYSASHAQDCSGNLEFAKGRRYFFLAQSTERLDKLGWFPGSNDGIGEGLGPRVLATSTAEGREYLWAGGEFTSINGRPVQSLTRFGAGNAQDTGSPVAPDHIKASSTETGKIHLTWRAGLDLDDSHLIYTVYRDGKAVKTLQRHSLPWTRSQVSFQDSVTPGQTYRYWVDAKDAAGNTSKRSDTVTARAATGTEPYPSAVRADGATLYWRYDDESTVLAADSSGTDHSGRYVGTPTLVQSPGALSGPSGAITLDGRETRIEDPHTAAVGRAFTIETWFKTTTTTGGKLFGFDNRVTFGSPPPGERLADKHVYMTNSGQLGFGVMDAAGKRHSLLTANKYNNGTWHHVAATQGPNGMKLYVDGKLAGTLNVTTHKAYKGFWGAGGHTLIHNPFVGWTSPPANYHFTGQLDETAVYPSALTDAQVKKHFDLAKAPTDTITKVKTTEDTYVNAGSPGTGHGASSSLAVRGNSAYETYLRFNLPKAPTGQVLKAASLQIKTSTQSGAGTTDKTSVVPVTTAWSEAGTTYKNKPTLGTTTLGATTAIPDGSDTHTIELNPTALSPLLGTNTSLALTGAGTDPLWIWSSEATATESTPQLLLTFGTK
ncbi:LamG-like jellyroll fold domain-containing protein [Streptomyces sp. NPDC047023]|uniref:CBM96 family carbohydrate-binding protein n=1 Tax=Streptomyces sp. NPDC047023 TaxID=3155139 RepID=UPI0033E74889